MTNRTAIGIVSGLTVGTIAVGMVSLAVWSLIPITVWSISVTIIGSQTMNVLRVKSGQLQPVIVKKAKETDNVIPMRQDA